MKAVRADLYAIESLHPRHSTLVESLNGLYRPESADSNRLQVPEQFRQDSGKGSK